MYTHIYVYVYYLLAHKCVNSAWILLVTRILQYFVTNLATRPWDVLVTHACDNTLQPGICLQPGPWILPCGGPCNGPCDRPCNAPQHRSELPRPEFARRLRRRPCTTCDKCQDCIETLATPSGNFDSMVLLYIRRIVYRWGQLKLDMKMGGGGGSLGLTLCPTWARLVSVCLTWTHLDSLEFTCIHLDSLGLSRTHLDPLGLTWAHLDSVGFNGTHLKSLGLTWTYLNSLVSIWVNLDSLCLPWAHLDWLGLTRTY